MPTVADELRVIQTELNSRFFERSEAIEGLMLAALTAQHCFILGPPGTAKSQLVRDFTSRFTGARYFEQLLSKNRPDAAVLGPYDLTRLRDHSEFVRKDSGFLTDCDFAFLDEIGKTSATLGHDLLAALNERLKHEVNAGRSAQPIPLHSAFTASNELPAAESEDMAALWDRLLVRVEVDYVRADANFRELMEQPTLPVAKTHVPFEDLKTAAKDVSEVMVMPDLLDGVLVIRNNMRKAGLSVSDRRWRASIQLIRASAYLAGREIAELEDLSVLRFSLWDDLTEAKKINHIILAVANPAAEEALDLLDGAHAIAAEMNSRSGESKEAVTKYLPEAMGKLKRIHRLAEKLPANTPKRAEIFALEAEIRKIGAALLGFTNDEMEEG